MMEGRRKGEGREAGLSSSHPFWLTLFSSSSFRTLATPGEGEEGEE